MIVKKIQKLCDNKNMTLKQLEKQLNIGNGTIAKWKKANPRFNTVEKIAKFFDVTSDFLLNRYPKEIELEQFGFFEIDNKSLIPVVGKVVAGKPLLAEEHIEEYVYINQTPSEEYFGLRVFGDSMTGARIFDGDTLIIHKQNTAESGQIVVALINGENATVKRYKRIGDQHILIAENPNYDPIIINGKNKAEIIGVVVEIRFKP